MPTSSNTIGQAAKRYIQTNSIDAVGESVIEDFMSYRAKATDGRKSTRIGNISVTEKGNWQLKAALTAFAKSRWDDREKAVHLVCDFFETIGANVHINLNDSYEHRVEPFVRIMKYIQEGGHTQRQIAEHFNTSTTTIEKYMAPLQDGVALLGKHVKIEELQRGSNTYDPSIHPVFLTLNLTEVNALTVALKQIFGYGGELADHPCSQQFLDIANDVYSQLSSYATSIINANAKRANVEFQKPLDYRREEMQIAYYLKSGERCAVTCAGFDEVLVGTFSLAHPVPGHVVLESESGEQYLLPYSGISLVDAV